MRARSLVLLCLAVALLAWPPQWYPDPVRISLSQWFGADAWRSLPGSRPAEPVTPEAYCPPGESGWRDAQQIDGVSLQAVGGCVADNPWLVAAAVRGTNNVSHSVLMRSGLTADAVE